MEPLNTKEIAIYPLTSYQKDIWLEQCLYKDLPIYNTGAYFDINGAIDYHRFQKSVSEVIQNNDNLRTRIITKNGQPYQQILPELEYIVPFYDFSNQLEAEKFALNWVSKEFLVPFDLNGQEPLFQKILLKLADRHFFWFWKVHHLITDGWGHSILFNDIIRYYNDAVTPNHRLEKYSYVEFIKEDRKYVGSETYRKDKVFWKQKFPYLPEPLFYRTVCNEAPISSRENLVIGRKVYNRIGEFCKAADCSVFHFFLGIFALYFGRVFSKDEIVMGVPILNRTKAVYRLIAGLFANVIPVKITLNADETFGNLLNGIKGELRECYRHQKLAYGEIYRSICEDGNNQGTLFEIRLSYERHDYEANFGETETVAHPLTHQHERTALTVFVREYDEGRDVDVNFDYRIRAFAKFIPIKNVIAHIEYLIHDILNDRQKKIRTAEIITPPEKKRLVREFNHTKVDYPNAQTIPALFAGQVTKNPDRIAVARGVETLTYRELNRKANRLALTLRDLGVRPDDIVGLMVERSLEMVIGMLAILKVGAAYLPIDPNYPAGRKKYMLADAGVKILLIQKQFFDRTADFTGIVIDSKGEGADVAFSETNGNPSQLAYIIYTSGSTGKPKGVMIEQRSIIRLVKNPNYISFKEDDRILQTGAVVFDASTFEIWGALLNGLQLCLVNEEVILDAVKVGREIVAQRITIMWLTAPLFNKLANQRPAIFKSLRFLLVGGDLLSPSHINKVRRVCPDTQIINGYGPTENTTFSTCFPIDRDYEDNIPIGKPISNSTAYILNQHNQLCPVGVTGELCVGGSGLSRGYLNQPELTKEKFIDNPFDPGERLYRTGDLARWLPDGNIEFWGRIDRQVKLRGFRVELGEIENRLSNYSGVTEVALAVKDEAPGSKFLCAYFVSDREIPCHELREYLAKDLPDYMIPSRLIRLEKMPLNVNGKIDWQALPDPAGPLDTGVAYEPPASEIENKLVALWQVILKVTRIGIHDNFFDLGGHSLNAAELLSQIHKEFGVELPLRDVFANPTIQELGENLAQRTPNIDEGIAKVAEREYYPLSSAQKRHYILAHIEGAGIVYNMPAALVLRGEFDCQKIEQAFQALITRHESLRTCFTMHEGEAVQKINPEAPFTIQYWDSAEAEVSQIITGFIQPFDLTKAPLLRVGLLKLGVAKHLLLLDMHHIISDGISFAILFKELVALYEERPLEPLKIQYKDYAVWQKSLAGNGIMTKQADYWLQIYQTEAPLLDLPLDYPRPEVQSFAGARISFAIEAALAGRLRTLAKENAATLFMVLLTGYYILLYKYSGQTDIAVGTLVAGRPHADLEKIIGMFVNTLALRNRPDHQKSVTEFLREVRENALQAYENRDYQFEELVEMLGLKRDLSRNALFDTMFTMENMAAPEFNVAGLKFELYEVPFPVAKFDLSISVTELNDQLNLEFEYCTALFKEATIVRLARHFVNVLRQMAANAAAPLGEIDLLTPEERRQILVDFNHTEAECAPGQTIQELFEAQVAQTPEHIALVSEEQQLTYRELNRKANQLARLLRARGVKPESGVAILMERSVAMVVALIAVLKAGGSFLPLDPASPQNRILTMLNDSQTEFLLTTSASIGDFSLRRLRMIQRNVFKLNELKQRPAIKDFDSIPIPDRTLIDYQKYHQYIGLALAKHTISLQATRGCPFNCAYCQKLWPKNFVTRSAAHIFNEILLNYQAGIRRFVFIDDIFNLDSANSSKLFHLIIANGLKVQLFFASGLRGDLLTKKYIDLMVRAGTVNIALALETASPRLQKLVKKNLNLERLRENIEYITGKYPQLILELFAIHGFPTETEAEAGMTLDFIKSIKWLHFPYLFILKICPDTDMARIAIANGISEADIQKSLDLAYHELPYTLPFANNFTRQCQTEFLNEYFLLKERLLKVLPLQMQVLTEDEIVQKYNSYLPTPIGCFDDLLNLAGIERSGLGPAEFLTPDFAGAPQYTEAIKPYFPSREPRPNALRILLLDLSQYFSGAAEHTLYDVVEPPLGLLYLQSYLDQKFGAAIHGKIAKARIDFNSVPELLDLITAFGPDLIGIRTLSMYRNFFHETVARLRRSDVDVPIIAGGPYATSEYVAILHDPNIDLIVLGEGEITLGELVGHMLANHRKWPAPEVLREIPGVAFVETTGSKPDGVERQILLTDQLDEELAAQNDANPNYGNHPNQLAYLIYTSGSTGQPKGVMIEQNALVNQLAGLRKTYHPDDSCRFMLVSKINFDVAVQQLFLPLISGSQLFIPTEAVLNDYREFWRYLVRNRINVLDIVPAFLEVLLDNRDGAEAIRLNLLFLGGDVFSPELLHKIRQKLDVFQIINIYGPTEATINATGYEWNGDRLGKRIPIGKPLLNYRAYILDNGGKPVPVGISGELYLAGAGLARGYLNNPELTAARFLPNPFRAGERMYRTGDLARWLPDGNIEFLGRCDQQVKLRGFRIELGEIESRLLSWEAIKEALVIAKETATQDKYLCAYLVADRKLQVSELRAYLQNYLPDYMVPTYLIQIAAMPLTSGGKIDRGTLPDPEGDLTGNRSYEAPRNEIEVRLAGIWRAILGLSRIGVNENFFEIGGHSLKATELMAQVHKEFHMELPLREIFKSPTIKALGNYLAQARESRYQGIAKVSGDGCDLMTSAQKRLYILSQMEGAGIAYNMVGALVVTGELDRERLEQAFQRIVSRHESLRTAFAMNEGKAIRKIFDQVTFAIEYREAGEAEAGQLVAQFIRKFDLEKPPLLRVELIKVAAAKHWFLFDMHHLIADGVSIGVLVRELAAFYEGKELPELPVQFQDYAVWQKGLYENGIIPKQADFWLAMYRDEVPVLNLPWDYPRPGVQSFAGAHFDLEIDEELVAKLNRLAVDNGATLYMVLLTGYYILLSKYSGQEDIVVGTLVAGRPHADLERIIGMFVNTLALRNRPVGSKSVVEFLSEVKENALLAYENQDYPFEELVERLAVKRDLSRNALFDTMFVLQNIQTAELRIKNLKFEPMEIQYNIAKVDLTFTGEEAAGKLRFTIEYCTGLFKKATIQRLAGHYRNILRSLTVNPSMRLSEVEILGAAERAQVLRDFNDTKTVCPKERVIQELFEEQVSQAPEKVAIVFGKQQLTYRELNRNANRLAIALRGKGVGAGSVVGLMVERSLEMLIGIMGILKAGGAYLPLDPEYPEQRKKYILKDSGAQIVLVDSVAAEYGEFHQEVIGRLIKEAAAFADTNPEVTNSSADLAYLIYTSGSTGQPKGVMIEHRAVCNFIQGMGERIDFDPSRTILALTTISFDIFVLETILPLVKGLKVVLASAKTQHDWEALKNLLVTEKIDILQATPSRMQMFANDPNFRQCLGRLTTLIVGGEVLTESLAQKLLSLPGVKIYNVYGPTETTVWVTVAPLTGEESLTIGKPIANTQVYIVNQAMRLCPVGIAGELCIAGDNLARGYHHQPALTAAKFVTNPFEPGRLMYRTGDLARWLPDGNLEFLGRLDDQVKIRGYRIEPGEIANRLLEYGPLTEAVVVAAEVENGLKSLCAYLVAHRDLTVSELREYLSQKLPEYMIPASFVQLAALPLTPNGKINRRALPQPLGNIGAGAAYSEPQSAIEKGLAETWREILGVERAGIAANFFELGGDSLKATTLVARIFQKYRVELPLSVVFQTPTIKQLAQYIEAAGLNRYIGVEPTPQRDYYPVSAAQKRIYILNELAGNAYHISEVLHIEGKLNRERLMAAFQGLIARHEILRTSFLMHAGELVQQVHDSVAFSVAYQIAEPDALDGLIKEFSQPFNLTQAPLFRVKLIGLTQTRHVLLFEMHHIIADGTSLNIMARELAALYQGRTLPELNLQYRDFATWQNGLLQTDKLQKQEEYWLDVFQGELPVAELPTDYPRPAVLNYEGDWYLVELDRELSQQLKKLGVHQDVTLFMILLAGFNLLLSRLTGQEDIIIGATVAGRNHADLEPLIGMFVNTVALRNYPRKELTFAAFLEAVKGNCLRGFANQDYQFEMLLDKLALQRNSNRNPLFDVMFNLLETKSDLLQISDDLKFIPDEFVNQTAKFDLELYFITTGQRIEIRCNYRTNLFEPATIAYLMTEYVGLLQQVVHNSELRLREYNILSPAKPASVNQSKVTAALLTEQEQLEQLIQGIATMDNDQVQELLAEMLKETS
jgi:amino acid adenylation domain-containing protein